VAFFDILSISNFLRRVVVGSERGMDGSWDFWKEVHEREGE
jgi:hypothetical protein